MPHSFYFSYSFPMISRYSFSVTQRPTAFHTIFSVQYPKSQYFFFFYLSLFHQNPFWEHLVPLFSLFVTLLAKAQTKLNFIIPAPRTLIAITPVPCSILISAILFSFSQTLHKFIKIPSQFPGILITVKRPITFR